MASSDPTLHSSVIRYYTDATQDYEAWSRRFNMHFGYWRRGLNPLRLEPMLDEMTRQVFSRLGLAPGGEALLLDMGCGLGASGRLITRAHDEVRVHALTLIAGQTLVARHLAKVEGVSARLSFIQGDYTRAPLNDAAYDGVYAIESACHADGPDKDEFIAEAARLLKKGGKLMIADGFLKHDRPMLAWFRRCYESVCRNWAVESFAQIDPFVAALNRHGLTDVRVEEISYRIAPSVMHIPWVTTRFLVRELWRTQWRIGSVRWGHVWACVLSPIVGSARSWFGYYLVSAVKK